MDINACIICYSSRCVQFSWRLSVIFSLELWDGSALLCEPIKRQAWPPHYLSNKRIQPPVQCKQCQCAESNGSTGSFCGRWLSKSLAPSSDQQLVFRDHALWEDGQAHPVWGAAVCSPNRANICDHGEVCQPHTRRERQGSNSLLASGGDIYRLRDLCDPAGVGSSQISHPEAAQFLHRDYTVVSTAAKK